MNGHWDDFAAFTPYRPDSEEPLVPPVLWALLAALVLWAFAGDLHAKDRVVYVGGGRSVCEGRSDNCKTFEAQERSKEAAIEAARRAMEAAAAAAGK